MCASITEWEKWTRKEIMKGQRDQKKGKKRKKMTDENSKYK